MNRLQFILLPALLFCTVSLFGQSSSHRALYISTIDEDDYAAVYDILQSTFDDFPAADDRKIKYESTTEDERLVIVLKAKGVRIFCHSRNDNRSEMSEKVEKVKAKIDLVDSLVLE